MSGCRIQCAMKNLFETRKTEKERTEHYERNKNVRINGKIIFRQISQSLITEIEIELNQMQFTTINFIAQC